MIGGPHDEEGSGPQLDFVETFDDPRLDDTRWVPHYLPQWTTPERSSARYDLDEDGLLLRIDVDQPAWREEDGGFRVSNIQTGTFSGAIGSEIGTHRHVPGIRVRTPVPTRRLWTPTSGSVEATLEASADPTCMLAIWLVGFEASSPVDSGEICIAELFGNLIATDASTVRLGVKAINDPRLTTDVVDVTLPFDATEPHAYGAEWSADGVRFLIDGQLVRTVDQGVHYPMQLMIDLFEFRPDGPVDATAYPKQARIRSVRGYRREARA